MVVVALPPPETKHQGSDRTRHDSWLGSETHPLLTPILMSCSTVLAYHIAVAGWRRAAAQSCEERDRRVALPWAIACRVRSPKDHQLLPSGACGRVKINATLSQGLHHLERTARAHRSGVGTLSQPKRCEHWQPATRSRAIVARAVAEASSTVFGRRHSTSTRNVKSWPDHGEKNANRTRPGGVCAHKVVAVAFSSAGGSGSVVWLVRARRRGSLGGAGASIASQSPKVHASGSGL